MKKRILSLLLALCLLCALLPASVFAEEAAELPKLATPTDLQWGKDGVPGILCWKAEGARQNHFETKVYRVGDAEPIYTMGHYYESTYQGTDFEDSVFLSHEDGHWGTVSFDSYEITTGSYYFTVQALGDGTQYADSEVAQSATWDYVRPEYHLCPVTYTGELSWDWPNAKWSTNWDTYQFGYCVDFLFAETEQEEPRCCGGTWGPARSGSVDGVYSDSVAVYDKMLQDMGEGYYYFRVKLVSNDITQMLNSAWSDLSSAYHLTDAVTAVKDGLSEILTNANESTDVRTEVQNLGTTDLKSALLTDKGEAGGTADLLTQLEAKTGVTVGVDSSLDSIAQSGVSIVGAALNDVPENTTQITLNIKEPEAEHVIPEQYNNTVALSFSMGLDGVTDQEDLKVPVKITLPVPTNINPEFLCILHYAQDGSVGEVLMPYLFQDNGTWFASFVLTKFSDFVMTEKRNSGSGDNGDSGSTGGGPIVIAPSVPAVKPAEKPEKQPEQPALTAADKFSDVAVNAWYAKAVDYVLQEGLITGYADGTFATNAALTRAQFAQILYNREKAPSAFGNLFNDVPADAWYAKAVSWAAACGIVSGYGNETFGPDDHITREQLAVMLWRYVGSPTASADLSSFKDADKMSGYAVKAIEWAISNGILNGKDGAIDPHGFATRAEAAQMLMSFLMK